MALLFSKRKNQTVPLLDINSTPSDTADIADTPFSTTDTKQNSTADSRDDKQQQPSWLHTLSLEFTKRQSEISSAEFQHRINTMVKSSNLAEATGWLEKFIFLAKQSTIRDANNRANTNDVPSLIAQLVPLYIDQKNWDKAKQYSTELIHSGYQPAFSHFQAATVAEALGNSKKALYHYQMVLARDVMFPKAFQRAQKLQAQHGVPPYYQAPVLSIPQKAVGTRHDNQYDLQDNTRYEIQQELGRGAHGIVYRGKDNHVKRNVAIKILYPQSVQALQKNNPGSLATSLLFQEAQLAASLNHPNILAIFDADKDTRQVVMEFAKHGTLADHLQTEPFSLTLALRYHYQLVAALQTAHAAAIVHRDIKPGNILFRHPPEDILGQIAVTDFGISHMSNLSSSSSVKSNGNDQKAGSWNYMAPEQKLGAKSDPAMDVFASGIVLQECLLGAIPTSKQQRESGIHQLFNQLTQEIPTAWKNEFLHYIHRLVSTEPTSRPSSTQAHTQAEQLLLTLPQ